MALEADGVRILSRWELGVKWGGLFPPPLLGKNRFIDYSILVFRKEGLQMTPKTVLLFSQTKTIGRSRILLPG